MFRALSRLLGAVQDHPGTPTPSALLARIEELERSEVRRNAEHADMVDRLDRLYKRISARIQRSGAASAEGTLPLPGDRSAVLSDSHDNESTLSLRQRLRGR